MKTRIKEVTVLSFLVTLFAEDSSFASHGTASGWAYVILQFGAFGFLVYLAVFVWPVIRKENKKERDDRAKDAAKEREENRQEREADRKSRHDHAKVTNDTIKELTQFFHEINQQNLARYQEAYVSQEARHHEQIKRMEGRHDMQLQKILEMEEKTIDKVCKQHERDFEFLIKALKKGSNEAEEKV